MIAETEVAARHLQKNQLENENLKTELAHTLVRLGNALAPTRGIMKPPAARHPPGWNQPKTLGPAGGQKATPPREMD